MVIFILLPSSHYFSFLWSHGWSVSYTTSKFSVNLINVGLLLVPEHQPDNTL